MNATTDAMPLDLVLKEQIECAAAMLEVLGLESEALHSGDTRALNETGSRKADLVESLEALESQRRSLSELSRPSTETDWQRLVGLLDECRQRNMRNGVLLNARRAQVVTALRLLRGHDGHTYDAAGMSHRGTRGGPLAEA